MIQKYFLIIAFLEMGLGRYFQIKYRSIVDRELLIDWYTASNSFKSERKGFVNVHLY